MKTILYIILLTILSSFSYSQTQKKKTSNNNFSKDVYYIDKQTKQRHGIFVKTTLNKKDTLVKGQYENSKKIGVWTFYSKDKKDKGEYIRYDYDSRKLVFFADSLMKDAPFLLKQVDGSFSLSAVDSPPIYLGYKDEFRILISNTLRIPQYILTENQSGTSGISFIVTKNGNISDIQVVKSFDKQTEKNIINILQKIDGEWLPALYQGKPIDSKFILLVSFNERYELNITEPYVLDIMFVTFKTSEKKVFNLDKF